MCFSYLLSVLVVFSLLFSRFNPNWVCFFLGGGGFSLSEELGCASMQRLICSTSYKNTYTGMGMESHGKLKYKLKCGSNQEFTDVWFWKRRLLTQLPYSSRVETCM
ncbi:hypothetical protein Ancab_036385 [Ancistrocladus abbreviatus]